MTIASVTAREIIDSRGNPTVEADVVFENGAFGRAAVPSGASTGSQEALELRDGDKNRFHGKGVRKAVDNVKITVANAVVGKNFDSQRALDDALLQLDGTENKANLGANAILAVSLAYARAAASSANLPLYAHLAGNNGGVFTLPVPMMNIVNGGSHADNAVDVQEFMIVPTGAHSATDAIRIGAEIFASLKHKLKESNYNTNIGDEGGFAPAFSNTEEALFFVTRSIEAAGYRPGENVWLALDAASSEFRHDGLYWLKGEGKRFDAGELIDYYEELINRFPIISIEDAMAEDDIGGWQEATRRLAHRIQLVGDDLFVTNPKILRKGIEDGLANAILIKPNQIGTLSETLDAMKIAREHDYNAIMSHRSGETEDAIIAHLAVATGCGQIKTGSLSRSDRLAKYNELIRIEEKLGASAVYPGARVFSRFLEDKGMPGKKSAAH
ncbi:MAG: phosphopyruvate hydratase [Rickettsiales bacterium]